jgi:hypothetical protein
MRVQEAIEMLNRMQADGVIDLYAIGGAVGATFYLAPLATVDVDVFVDLQPEPGKQLIDPQPIFRYLSQHGCEMEGEYVVIGGWPVQFLAPTGPLVQEALKEAVKTDVEGTPTRVFSAEHLAAICLETGRAKDKARLLQFLESGSLDMARFLALVSRHGLDGAWEQFHLQFLREGS